MGTTFHEVKVGLRQISIGLSRVPAAAVPSHVSPRMRTPRFLDATVQVKRSLATVQVRIVVETLTILSSSRDQMYEGMHVREGISDQ